MSRVKVGESGVTQEKLDKMAKKRVVLILDEYQRSAFGDMLHDIRSSFSNVPFFGFSEAPIQVENQRKGATAAMTFRDRLHRQSIVGGIRDHSRTTGLSRIHA